MNVSWAILKSFVTARSLSIQWIDLGESYTLKAIDNYYILDSSVDKNTAECTDFETNFKPAGNSPLTSNGAVRVNIRNAAGIEIGGAAAPIRVDTAGTTTQPVSGSVNAQIGTTAGAALGAGYLAQVSGYGALRTTNEAKSIFYDPFDTALETTTKWNAAVTSGGATATQGVGGYTLASGTTVSSYAYISSKPTFVGLVPGYAQVGFANKLGSGQGVLNSYAFWGVGTAPSAPTTAAPLTNAVGWELATDGKLYAVVYASGTRTVIQDLSVATGNSKQQTDGLYHRYVMTMRTDKTFWFIDGLDTPVATSNFQFPNIQMLPLRMQVVNNTVAPASSQSLISTGVGVGDTGGTHTTIGDGTNPFVKAAVTTSAPTTSASALVVRTIPLERSTYSSVALSVATALDKSMFSIKNTGTSIVRIVEIRIVNSQGTAVSGVNSTFGIYRIASYTNGLGLVTPAYDSADPIPLSIFCHTGATVSGEIAEVLKQCTWSNDEWVVGTQDVESTDHVMQQLIPFWTQLPNTKPITIRQNEGINIKHITNTTTGRFDIHVVFTVE